MTPYFLILILLLFTTILRGLKGRNLITASVFMLMMFLCGWRGKDVGVDTVQYYGSYLHGSDRYEPMFQLVSYFCYTVGFSFKEFLMCYALLTFIPLYVFIRKVSVDAAFSVLIFLTFSAYFYHETFNTMRVYAAMTYVLFAYYYVERGSNWKALCFFLIGCLFHYSAIVTIPFVILFKCVKHISFVPILLTIVLSVVFGLIFAIGFKDMATQLSLLMEYYSGGDLAEYYQKSLDNMEETTFSVIGTLAFMLPFSAFSVFMYDKTNSRSLYYKLFLVAAVLQNVFISVVLTYRMTMFFLILIVVVLPNSFNRAKGFRRLSLAGLSAFMVLWYVYQLVRATPESFAGTVPYHF